VTQSIRFWPISEVKAPLVEVGLLGSSGLDLLKLSSSHFDPKQTSLDSPHYSPFS
jgi:hypothetical protein